MDPHRPPSGERPPGASFPPPQAPAAGPRWFDVPVWRAKREGPLGGVIAGLSYAYRFDRRLARIVAVVCSFVAPALVIVYCVAWALLPEDPSRAESLRQLVTSRGRRPLWILLAIGLVLSGIVSSDGLALHGIGWAVMLVVLGLLLWNLPDRTARSGGPAPGYGTPGYGTPGYGGPGYGGPTGGWSPGGGPGPAGSPGPTGHPAAGSPAPGPGQPSGPIPGPVPEPASASSGSEGGEPETGPLPAGAVSWDPPAAHPEPATSTASYATPAPYGTAPYGSGGWGGSVAAPPPAYVPGARSGRRRYPVFSIAFALVAVVVGAAAAGDGFGWWVVDPAATIVAASLALAGAIVLSAVANRGAFRVALVLPLLAVAWFFAATRPELRGGVGERSITAVATSDGIERLAVGQLTIDARTAAVPADAATPVVLRARVGMGRLHVIVPAGAGLILRTQVGTGHVVVDGRERVVGVRVSDTLTEPAAAGAPTFDLDLRVGSGEISVERAAAGATR